MTLSLPTLILTACRCPVHKLETQPLAPAGDDHVQWLEVSVVIALQVQVMQNLQSHMTVSLAE